MCQTSKSFVMSRILETSLFRALNPRASKKRAPLQTAAFKPRWRIVFLIVALVIFALVLLLSLLRLVSPREIDDVHPLIPCKEKYLAESNILWIIPLFDNVSIAENQTWCASLHATNKTFGMHGVYHTYNEFLTPRDQTYLEQGIAAFEKCFGKKPEAFKAPQLALSAENAKLLRRNNLTIHGKLGQLTHKVYHCNDTGRFKNWLIRLV